MMNRLRNALVIVMIMMGLITESMAGWQSATLNFYRTGGSQSTGITEEKAISIAQQHFKGRILSINHSDDIFRIKILNNQGIVHIILINAINGTIISTH